ncbi:hypothetical protein V2J09_021940 [Rumex salicifolius]
MPNTRYPQAKQPSHQAMPRIKTLNLPNLHKIPNKNKTLKNHPTTNMETWKWTHRTKLIIQEKINPLMPSWRICLRRHPGRTYAVGNMLRIPTWSRSMLNKISAWSDYDSHTLLKFLMIKSEINIITWNAQGARSKDFMQTLREIIRIHDPTILVLVETRMSGPQADKVCGDIGFDGMTKAEAVGFRGGIWVLWRKQRVDLKEIDVHQQVVTNKVTRKEEEQWFFSAIYASPQPASREECGAGC